MADLVLTFEVEGELQLARRLLGVRNDLKDWTAQFVQTGNLLTKTFKETFNVQGKNIGESWTPLKPSTIAEKARLGFPLDPLIRTGKMSNSFVSKPTRFEVVISNPTPYFIYHQSRQPRHKLPRRVMMKLDERRREMIVKIFQSSIQDKLKQRGFVANG